MMGLVCTCPECGGDGVETCTNPDHGFINGVGGEIGRLGCPGCIRGNPKHPGQPCLECDGAGVVTFEAAKDYLGIDLDAFIWDNDNEADIDAYAEWSVR